MSLQQIVPGFNEAEYEEITVSTTAVGITAAIMQDASGRVPDDCVALLTLEAGANDLRFRCDGTAATATVGHFIDAGINNGPIVIPGGQLVSNLSMVRDTGAAGDATVQVTVMRRSAA